MTTKKVIFAEALLLSVRDDPEIDGQHFARFKEHIDNAPDAMKHGRWVSSMEQPRLIYECSVCKDKWSYGAILNMKYCPNCDAKMDLPQITEQTRNALVKMGEKVHGGGNG